MMSTAPSDTDSDDDQPPASVHRSIVAEDDLPLSVLLAGLINDDDVPLARLASNDLDNLAAAVGEDDIPLANLTDSLTTLEPEKTDEELATLMSQHTWADIILQPPEHHPAIRDHVQRRTGKGPRRWPVEDAIPVLQRTSHGQNAG